MANLNGFNANEVEPSTDFDPVPAGKYLAAIVESKHKPTKAGTGKYLELKFQILEGEYRNRNLWARLNLENPNPEAVQDRSQRIVGHLPRCGHDDSWRLRESARLAAIDHGQM